VIGGEYLKCMRYFRCVFQLIAVDVISVKVNSVLELQYIDCCNIELALLVIKM